MSRLWIAAGDVLFYARQDMGGNSVQLLVAALLSLCRIISILTEGQQVIEGIDEPLCLLDFVGGDNALVDPPKCLELAVSSLQLAVGGRIKETANC